MKVTAQQRRAAFQQLLAFAPQLEKRTIAQAIDRFRAEYIGRQKPNTLRIYDHYLLRLERAVGRRLCDAPCRELVLSWYATLEPSPANWMAYLLGRVLRCAISWGWRFEAHGLDGLCTLRMRKRERVFSLRQRIALLEYLGRAVPERVRVCHDVIELLVFSGWRVSEACSLRWSWLDADERLAHLPDTKTGPQTRALGEASWALIERRPRQCDFVFPRRSLRGPVGISSVSTVWSDVRRDLGLDGLMLSSFRHTVCTVGAQQHLHPSMIAALVGHTNRFQQSRYTHPSFADVRDAAATVELGLVAGKGGRA